MCIGIPMQVIKSDGFIASCHSMGQARLVNTILIGEVSIGTWLLVQGDTAYAIMEENDAQETINLLKTMHGFSSHDQ